MSSFFRFNANERDFLFAYLCLFLSYTFGIETINTFIHSRSFLKNHTRFQTKMHEQSLYPRYVFRTIRCKNHTLWGGTYFYDWHKGLYPGLWWHHLISNAGRRNTEMDYRTSPTRQQTKAPEYTLSSLKSQNRPSILFFVGTRSWKACPANSQKASRAGASQVHE